MAKVVLVGGCFDILHLGHIIFLEKARKKGDKLVVLLESDKRVRELKGEGRPIHTQKDRARVLSAIKSVDKIISLPSDMKDGDYDKLVKRIRPSFIATTKGDSNLSHKIRQAKLVGARIVEIENIKGLSSSKLAKEIL